jgi:NhaP-type Na+/H+ or K+/H+ antiporter
MIIYMNTLIVSYHPLFSTEINNGLHIFGIIAAIFMSVYIWDPSQHMWFAEKDYPFDGLRVELGGDPCL